MKASYHAINKLYAILKTQGAVSCPVYKYEKPTSITPAEYVVLNALPISGGVLQKLTMNVNYYVKDLAEGIPNVSRLDNMSAFLLPYLEQVSDNTLGIYIDFESQQIIPSRETGEHYINFRIKVKLLNNT